MAAAANTSRPDDAPLRLGFGASGAWSERWFSKAKAHRLVAHAIDRGITHFDTASFYAKGQAETRLGEALAELSHPDVEVSTKTGTVHQSGKPSVKDFSDANIRKDVEQSLKRLRRDRLDIVYLHGPNNWEVDGTREIFTTLKQEGKIRFAGVCGFKSSLKRGINADHIDVIMGTYNVADMSHAAEFEQAKAKGMGTVGIAALVPGLGDKNLTRPKSFADIWYLLRAIKHNRPFSDEIRKRLREIAARHGHTSIEQVMLGFALAQPNIDTILTNTTRLSHLDANIDTAAAPPLSAELLAELAQFCASLPNDH